MKTNMPDELKSKLVDGDIPIHSFDQIEAADLNDSEQYVAREYSDISENNTFDEAKNTSCSKLIGVVTMMIANIGFIINGVFIKITYTNRSELTGYDVLLIRSLIMLPIVYIQAKFSRVNLIDMKLSTAWTVFLRSISGSIAIVLLFTTLQYLPTSLTSVGFNMNPIIVSILAFPMLGERISCINLLTTIGAFGGIATIAFNRNNQEGTDSLQLFGFGLGISGAFFGALSYIWMRKMNREVHYLLSPFYLGLAGYLQIAIIFFVKPTFLHYMTYTKEDITYMLVAGLGAGIGQVFISLAFKFADASFLSPMTYTNVIMFFIVDTFYFNSQFYTLDFIGTVVVLICLALPVIKIVISRAEVSPASKE